MSLHELFGISGIYVAFERHICCWNIYAHIMLSKSWNLLGFLLVCAVMWGQHAYYISRSHD